MQDPVLPQDFTPEAVRQLRSENAQLRQQLQSLQQQLDWFKRQLFGRKSEKRLIENLSYEQIHAIMEAMPFEVTFVDADEVVAKLAEKFADAVAITA